MTRALVAAALVALLPAASGLHPYVDHDTWWHLRVGQIVSESGTVPRTDPFSRLGPVPWRAYSWLYEWGLFQAHRAGGLGGVMWMRAALSTTSAAVLLAFWFRRTGPTPAGLLLSAAVGLVLLPMATERPWHLTILFTTLTAWAAVAVREGMPARRAVWLPLVFVVWANVHIQFVLGLGVLAAACMFPGKAKRAHVLLLAAGCAAATLVNPYHVGLYAVVWEYAADPLALGLVQELAPPAPFAPWTVAAVMLLLRAAASAVRKPVDGFAVLLVAAAMVLSLRMSRDLWLAAVAAAAVPAGGTITTRRVWQIPVAVVAVFLAARVVNGNVDYAAAAAERFPVKAVGVARDQPGPLFNDFDWGGYLIWALPEHPVSIDGRTNLHGGQAVRRSIRTWNADDWRGDVLLMSARVVVAPRGRPLTAALPWHVVYEDEVAVVLVRTD